MADAQVLISQASSLPIEVIANIESDAQAILTLSGSVWSPTANRMIGFTLFIDGEPTNISAEIFSNQASEHRAVVPVTIPYTFDIGQHPATSDTTSDGNDRFSLTVLY